MIRRVNADFVPVFVSPPHSSIAQSDEDEGRLFRSAYRSRVADQGLCVMNAGGQALDWVLMFDDDASILTFLDHALKRFQEHPDARQSVLTERYMHFPSQKLEAEKTEDSAAPIPERHPAGTHCPALAFESQLPPGTVAAAVIGRALDANGNLSADTMHQEQYAGDQIYVTPDLQEALAKSFAAAGTGPVRLPNEFGRLCVMHAYLGQIDVRPLSNPLGATSDLKQCDFWAERIGGRTRPGLMRVEGRSAVRVGYPLAGAAGAGHDFSHDITLTWEGFIEMEGSRMTRLVLSGRGTEKLRWGSEALQALAKSGNASSFLVAGHPIDLDCGVRYGIVGKPIAALEGQSGQAGGNGLLLK